MSATLRSEGGGPEAVTATSTEVTVTERELGGGRREVVQTVSTTQVGGVQKEVVQTVHSTQETITTATTHHIVQGNLLSNGNTLEVGPEPEGDTTLTA